MIAKLISIAAFALPFNASASDDYRKQQQVEEEILEKSQPLNPDLTTARKIVGCIADKQPTLVARYLNAHNAKQREKVQKNYRYFLSKCLYEWQQETGSKPMAMRLSSFSNNSLLAEAYLQRNGIPEFDALTLAQVVESKWYRTVSPVYRLSSCLAYTQPVASKNLVMSAVDSVEEKAAFTAISPLIAACVPQGSTLTINKVWLRLRLATSFYYFEAPKSAKKVDLRSGKVVSNA